MEEVHGVVLGAVRIPKEGIVEDIQQGWTVFIALDESGLLNNAEWGVKTANLQCGTSPSDEEKNGDRACIIIMPQET